MMDVDMVGRYVRTYMYVCMYHSYVAALLLFKGFVLFLNPGTLPVYGGSIQLDGTALLNEHTYVHTCIHKLSYGACDDTMIHTYPVATGDGNWFDRSQPCSEINIIIVIIITKQNNNKMHHSN